jgi:hypothetical protein
MSDNFDEFIQMKAAGVGAKTAFLYAGKLGLDYFAQIRMLRSVFNLSLVEAKEVSVTADGSSLTLEEHQAKLFPALKAVLDDTP